MNIKYDNTAQYPNPEFDPARNPYAQQQPAYDTGDDDTDFQGTLLDPYWSKPQYREEEAVSGRSRMALVAAVLGVVACAFAAMFVFTSTSSTTAVPTIKADAEPYKMKPTNPGGIEIPFQDKMIFNRMDETGEAMQAERLLPPAEQPLNLALQPKLAEPSAPLPTGKLAVKEVKADAKPFKTKVAEVAPMEKFDNIAPTSGPVPAPVNDNIPATPKEVPVQAVTPTVEAAPAATTKAAAPKAIAAGDSRIQLVSVTDKASADKAAASLQSKYAGALGGAALTVVRADLGAKGVYYRVQSQSMSKSDATSICNAIKAGGGTCILAK